MKKILFFIPTIVVLVFLFFILFVLIGPSNQLDDYITGIAVLSVFFVSDWLLSKQKWYGSIFGILFGMYIIYYGSQYHGQIFDERPIGMVIGLYYVILAIITYKSNPRRH